MDLITSIVLLVILLLLSGFFSGAEVAMVSLSRVKIRHMIEQKKRNAKLISNLKNDPDTLLSTILLGNNLVNVGSSVIATTIALELFDDTGIGIATGVMTLLLLVFGEITPKSIAVRHNELFAGLVARPIYFISIVCSPIIKVLKIITKAINPHKKQPLVTEDELKSYIDVGQEEGVLKKREQKMIQRIFEFDDARVSEIMTPRLDMRIVPEDMKIDKLISIAAKEPYSRLPVHASDKDDIIGIVYVKHIFKHIKDKKKKTAKDIMRKPLIFPETKKMDEALREFQKQKEHMALIVDEHGIISGLITLEDILEELVGEIMDETDRIEKNIRNVSRNEWVVSGKTAIDEINEALKIDLKDENVDTFNGLIIEELGRPPKVGDEVAFNKFLVCVEKVDGYRVEQARIKKGSRKK